MIRALLGLAFGLAASVAIYAHHQLLFGIACIVAGACVMSWPTKR